MVLMPKELKRFYDRFGGKQDSQGFYEDPALDDLTAHAEFDRAEQIFEFGCGTGKYASTLLAGYLPPTATYQCSDVSTTMTELARSRLVQYGERATILQSDGSIRFPLPDHSVDHVVCAYVLDLLSDDDIRRAFSEAYRVLLPGGMFCITCLTRGITVRSAVLSSLWSVLFRLRPSWVGGCRPISLIPFIDRDRWYLKHRNVITPYGVPSEILVLSAKVLLVDDR